MQQLKTFFYSFSNSLTNPKYYTDVLKAKAWFSWKYFLLWNILISLVALVYIVPPIISFNPEEVTNEVISVYPAELEIYGSEQGISINQERPYTIPFPEKWTATIPQEAKEDIDINDVPLDEAEKFSLVRFDTDQNIQNIRDYYDAQSFVVLTETTVYVLDDSDTGGVRVYEMPSLEKEFTFSVNDLKNLEQKVLSHPFVAQRWYVPLLALFIILIMIPLTIWWRIITIAVYSVFVWIGAGFFLKKLKLSYAKAFQVGLHSLTLPVLLKVLIDLVANNTTYNIQLSGLWFFLTYLVWTMFVLSRTTRKTNKRKKA